MLKALLARLHQGHRTLRYPAAVPPLPDRFRGLPVLDASKCPDGCRACAEACPTGAVTADGGLRLDLGKCLFCTDCVESCPAGAIVFGDINDPKSQVKRLKDTPLNYALLDELNTHPRTTYLAAVRNPNTELEPPRQEAK